jgi:hypothetical protein
MKLNNIVIATLISSALSLTASAQLVRTFVSVTGADSATCGDIASPCRNFAQGINRTNDGGAVIALDSGIYDPSNFSITRSITLEAAPGVHAELFNFVIEPSVRIDISASKQSTVILRNLYISYTNNKPGGTAILAERFGDLQIENCVINGFARGINIDTDSHDQVSISNTVVRNGSYGVSAQSSGLVKVSINNCRFENFSGNGNDPSSDQGNGVEAFDNAHMLVRNSVASGADGAGFLVGASGADLVADNCGATGDRDGFSAPDTIFGSGTMTVSNSVASFNSRSGFFQSGSSTFNSLGNNTVRRNGAANTTGTITVVSGT